MSWLNPVILQGAHATLVPLTIDHSSALSEAVKEDELWKLWYATVPAPDHMITEIQRRLDLQKKRLMLPFAVIDNATKTAIGMTTYCTIDETNKRMGIGWTWYKKSIQRTAINTECKYMLLTHAFEKLQCIAIEFRVHYFNQRSQKAVERLGAKYDGLIRNARIMPNGTIGDYCVYSIIDTEWPVVKCHLTSKLEFLETSSL